MRCKAMAMGECTGKACFFVSTVAVLSFLLAGVFCGSSDSEAVIPAFAWSDVRLFGEEGRSVNYESHTSDSLGTAIFDNFGKRTAPQDSEVGDEKLPELVVAFIGQELRTVDVSSPSKLVEVIQTSMEGAKYSLSVPYVTVASDKTSVADSFLSNVHKNLGAGLKMGESVVTSSCSVQNRDIKKLAGVFDVEAYLSGRKSSRAQGETDVLVVCYTPLSFPGFSMSEGKALTEVLSVLKSTGTSHVTIYTSDPMSQSEGHYGVLVRHLIATGTGNTTTDCDALCRSRAVILEGIFVAIVLITILVSGICCMKAVTSPLRFELPKES